jgi:hypothetical protein
MSTPDFATDDMILGSKGSKARALKLITWANRRQHFDFKPKRAEGRRASGLPTRFVDFYVGGRARPAAQREDEKETTWVQLSRRGITKKAQPQQRQKKLSATALKALQEALVYADAQKEEQEFSLDLGGEEEAEEKQEEQEFSLDLGGEQEQEKEIEEDSMELDEVPELVGDTPPRAAVATQLVDLVSEEEEEPADMPPLAAPKLVRYISVDSDDF